jgi:DNA-binding CsgD family transcriptional regulator
VTELYHYGTPRHSGRYPWGSGGDDEARNRSFLGYVEGLKNQGMSEVEIAAGLAISTTELRARKAIAKAETRAADVAAALRLKEKGLSNTAIGERMHLNESSVRALLNPALNAKRDALLTTAKLLQDRVDGGHYLDIGEGTSNHLAITKTRLATAVAVLREKGYEVHNVQVAQIGTTHKTTVKVLAPPGTKYVDIVKNPDRIKTVAAYSDNGGQSYTDIKPPVNVSSKRIDVRYAEQGGDKADGVIYVRPGVPDVSLGSAKYAQVRIAVDGTHYLKGMAVYKNDLPAGIDLQFNTNKSDTGNKLDALKPQKDEVNPFGATIHQRYFKDASGKSHLSAMNIVNEQGDWSDWSRNLSSQFLSKQSTVLARRQLDLTLASKREQLAEIGRLTNPVVRKKLLDSFADDADSSAVHLKAAALPRQGTHVILPIQTLREGEVYAPNYENGDRVVLVRFPHGGTFELPEVTVNNKNAEARATLGAAPDAVGIHPKVAARLSGADFDGDHVLVIPNPRGEIKTAPALAGLKDFDPKNAYPPFRGMKTIDGGSWDEATHRVDYGDKKPSGRAKQQQMGDVSNLITDMTIKGANSDELARAVRHSMVVIDAEKHSLNYKQSYTDNGIASLKEKYQGRGATGRLAGASTIVSRAGSEIRVADRRLRPASEGGPVNPTTGAKVYVTKDTSYIDKKTGQRVTPTVRSTKLAEESDARKLSSGMPIENVYADHSNALKALANEARKQSVRTGGVTYSPSAAKVHDSEVKSLTSKLDLAVRNKPLERQAQLVANTIVAAKRESNPGMDSDTLKKVKNQALVTARTRVGARKQLVDITPEEWKAIQSGAVSTSRLREILDNADPDQIKKFATPRLATVVTPAKLAIIESRLAAGYTQAEIAKSLGIPVSTLNSAVLRKEANG